MSNNSTVAALDRTHQADDVRMLKLLMNLHLPVYLMDVEVGHFCLEIQLDRHWHTGASQHCLVDGGCTASAQLLGDDEVGQTPAAGTQKL